MAQSSPVMIVIAGPNGAGKSTLYDLVIGPDSLLPFVNADIIQKHELKDKDPKASYLAAKIAETQRRSLLDAKAGFIMESVFSHSSKLQLIRDAKKAGYHVIVHHVGVSDADFSVKRVTKRVRKGGHPVPEDKIRARYARNGAIIRQAIFLADAGSVYDNSVNGRPPRLILDFRNGQEVERRPPLPAWVTDIYG